MMGPFGFGFVAPPRVERRLPQDIPAAPFGFAAPPSKWEQTAAILNEYNPVPAFWRLMNSEMAQGGEITDQNIADGLTVGGTVMGASSVVPKPSNALNMGIKAYHVSPNDFTEFKPSEFRGSSFFSPTERGAKSGAYAARAEMAMETATDLPPVNWRTYEVQIDPNGIAGLSLTPNEKTWFTGLPEKVVGDDALTSVLGDVPHGLYWDDVYDYKPLSDTVFEYTKKDKPPSLSYEEAVKTGRDVYHRQHSHYNNGATDEKAAARNTAKNGMGGYLVHDEGGLSIAVVDPKIISIVRKYGIAGASALLGYNVLDGLSDAQAAELKKAAK